MKFFAMIATMMVISGAAFAHGDAMPKCAVGYAPIYAPLEHRYVCHFVGTEPWEPGHGGN